MVARLKRYVERRLASVLAGLLQCHDFRVVTPVVLMKAFADNRAIFHNDAAHRGIRARQPDALARQIERMLHEMQIVIVHRRQLNSESA
jgi:hypothetical protein